MIDDKWIGLCLAVSSSLAIGTSFIITKKGLNAAKERAERQGTTTSSDDLSYLRNPIWWAGISTLVLGEIANFAAYTFAPPILVTPLGALSVLIGAVLASLILHEELGQLGRLGCALCLMGSVIIVLHAPEDKPVETVDEILRYATQPGFLMYCLTVFVFAIVMIYTVAPKYGRSNPIVYISICSLVGSVSVMAIKGFGVAVKLTFNGKNQFTHGSTYVFGITVVTCILVQMNYFNKALDTFSTNVVNPMYYVGFSTCTVVASLILFQGFNTTDATNTISLLSGFIVTFLGVHLLNISRQPDPPPLELHPDVQHSALESGLMNPRLSLQGRLSLEGWNGVVESPRSAAMGHGRQSSLYRTQTSTIYDSFEDGSELQDLRSAGNGAAARDLPEVAEEDEEDDDMHDAHEQRTLLGSAKHTTTRSLSRSPTPMSRNDHPSPMRPSGSPREL